MSKSFNPPARVPDERVSVIFLHGFLASSAYWLRFLRYFNSSHYRIVTIDLLGFGKAPKPSDSTYNYDAHLAYINEQLNENAVNQPFILIGHSMGALLAARFSVLYPNKIKAVILLHPPLYLSRDEARATLRNTSPFYRFLLDSRFRGIGWGILRNLPYSGVSRHTIISRERSMRNIIEAGELPSDLTLLQPNTLLVVGSRDRPQYQYNLAHIQPSSSVTITLEAVNHHSPFFRPKFVAQLITSFLKTAS